MITGRSFVVSNIVDGGGTTERHGLRPGHLLQYYNCAFQFGCYIYLYVCCHCFGCFKMLFILVQAIYVALNKLYPSLSLLNDRKFIALSNKFNFFTIHMHLKLLNLNIATNKFNVIVENSLFPTSLLWTFPIREREKRKKKDTMDISI